VDGLGEPDLLVSNVVVIAEGSDEGITQDPLRSESGSVHIEHGQGAVSTAEFEVEDVFNSWDVVWLASDGEDKIRKTGLGAWHGVDAILEVVGGSSGRDNGIDSGSRASQP